MAAAAVAAFGRPLKKRRGVGKKREEPEVPAAGDMKASDAEEVEEEQEGDVMAAAITEEAVQDKEEAKEEAESLQILEGVTKPERIVYAACAVGSRLRI